MNYELALKLKESGFPQEGNICSFWGTSDGTVNDLGESVVDIWCADFKESATNKETMVLLPLLEELINACSGRTIKLWICPNGKSGTQLEGESLDDVIYYRTTSESVANLWLELNKK